MSFDKRGVARMRFRVAAVIVMLAALLAPSGCEVIDNLGTPEQLARRADLEDREKERRWQRMRERERRRAIMEQNPGLYRSVGEVPDEHGGGEGKH